MTNSEPHDESAKLDVNSRDATIDRATLEDENERLRHLLNVCTSKLAELHNSMIATIKYNDESAKHKKLKVFFEQGNQDRTIEVSRDCLVIEYGTTFAEIEYQIVNKIVEMSDGCLEEASRFLGVTQDALNNKMQG